MHLGPTSIHCVLIQSCSDIRVQSILQNNNNIVKKQISLGVIVFFHLTQTNRTRLASSSSFFDNRTRLAFENPFFLSKQEIFFYISKVLLLLVWNINKKNKKK